MGLKVVYAFLRDPDLVRAPQREIARAAAPKLGVGSRSIASVQATEIIHLLRPEKLGKLNLDMLIEEMCDHPEIQFDKYEQLMAAFINGFVGH